MNQKPNYESPMAVEFNVEFYGPLCASFAELNSLGGYRDAVDFIYGEDD